MSFYEILVCTCMHVSVMSIFVKVYRTMLIEHVKCEVSLPSALLPSEFLSKVLVNTSKTLLKT